MSLFDYDYDDLAVQVQNGLERLGVNFLRGHGARVLRDVADFHGVERVELELSHGGHSLKIHQVGPPRGPGESAAASSPGAGLEEFESLFDGWPASVAPTEVIASWLRRLPAGPAPVEKPKGQPDAANPFARESRSRPTPSGAQPDVNPFLVDRPRESGANPFLDPDRDRKRQDALRLFKDDDE